MPPKRAIEDFFPAKSKKKHFENEVQESLPITTSNNAESDRVIPSMEGATSEDSKLDETNSSSCSGLCCGNGPEKKPYQPPAKEFKFKHKGRSFQQSWYTEYPWLTVCAARGKALCYICREATTQGLIKFSKCSDQAFTEVGFNNWKKAQERFKKHEGSESHKEAVLKLSRKNSKPIEEMISTQEKSLQTKRREGLLKMISSLLYLLRQGLAIRGHCEEESNLCQLLKLRSEDSVAINEWLLEEKYMSHDIINELIDLLGKDVLFRLLEEVKSASPPWFAIIADEATDVSKNEQMNISIRSVSEDYSISEDPICLIALPDTFSNTLVRALKDALTRAGLQLLSCRGQAYDGASNMQGVRSGVATQVQREVPGAVPIHCFAHCLQLVLQETGRQCKALRDALELVRETVKLIKLSPKRSTLFSNNLEAYEGGVTLKPLCPTRWTVRTAAFQAVLEDFVILQETMEEISETTNDEYGQKANGIAASLGKFETVFGLKLGYLIFSAAEQLSRTLQGKDTTLQEAMTAVALAKKHYMRLRTEEEFNRFYGSCVTFAEGKSDAPALPRYRRAPARLDDGAAPHRFDTPKSYFRAQYNEVCDLIQGELDRRFDQEKVKPVVCLEKVLLGAANGSNYSNDFELVRESCYKDDLDCDRLQHQLHMLPDVVKTALPDVKQVTNVRTICDAMNSSPVVKSLLGEVHKLLRLYLTVPVTSATSERTFSALRRLKNFLRSTMKQDRLNNCLLIHCHKTHADNVDIVKIAKAFASVNDLRKIYFGQF